MVFTKGHNGFSGKGISEVAGPLSMLLLLAVIAVFALTGVLYGGTYWQQEVNYDIEVALNDSLHTLDAYETITYINNSPDTLDYLWFHLWANAYRDNSTALVQQQLRSNKTNLFYADSSERGYIDSLDFRQGETSLDWEYHTDWIDVAQVHLADPVAPGDTAVISTPFFVKLPKVFSRMGHTGQHYEITQWYPKPAVYDRKGWHPMPYLDIGEFYSEYGTFDVNITLPAEYRIMATGTLVDGEEEYRWLDSLAAATDSMYASEKKPDERGAFQRFAQRFLSLFIQDEAGEKPARKGRKTLHFRQDNVHDFAWFADKRYLVQKGELWLADSTHQVRLWSMYLPKHKDLWENSIEYLHDTGYYYSQFFGEYPYQHITAVDGDLSAGGGMEYPNITVISKVPSRNLLEFVIMHEVGHNWFYGIYGTNERDHAWMDEGMNTYGNFRYWENKYAERDGALYLSEFLQKNLKVASDIQVRWLNGYLSYTTLALAGREEPIDLPATDFTSMGTYSTAVYGKTGIFMRYLQETVGEAAMDTIMHDYYRQWALKHPYPEDFRAMVDAHTTVDTDWFFEDGLRTTRRVDYAVRNMTDNTVVLENPGEIVLPLRAVFYDAEDQILEERWLEGFTGTHSEPAPESTETVILSPDQYLPDIDYTNNALKRPVKIRWALQQPEYIPREAFVLPWATWNHYNGFVPGVMAYSGVLPGYRFGVTVRGGWDFLNRQPVGYAKYYKNFYDYKGLPKIQLYAAGKKHSGQAGAEVGGYVDLKQQVNNAPGVRIYETLYYNTVDQAAVHPNYYQGGSFTVSTAGVEIKQTRSPFFSYTLDSRFTQSMAGSNFSKLHLAGNMSWRYSKKYSLDIRTWAGGFFSSRDIPTQYAIWLGGGVDPTFSKTVFNRTGDGGASPYNIYDEQYLPEGPALRGTLLPASREIAWGVNASHKIPFVPLQAFCDIGGASDQNRVFTASGVLLDLFFLKLITPLYQSWDPESTMPDSKEWLLDRMRFQFNMNISISTG